MIHRPGFERAAHVLAAVAVACGLLAAAALVESVVSGPAFAPARLSRAPLTHGPRGDIVARVAVPRLGLDAAIFEGVDSATLAQGPGHLPGTPLPGEETGANHSLIVVPRDVGWGEIAGLHVGDHVEMRTPSGIKDYRVRQLRLGSAEEVRAAGSRRPGVTLFTAYPPDAIGPAPLRLAIVLEHARPLEARALDTAAERRTAASAEVVPVRSARSRAQELGRLRLPQPARLASNALTRSTGRTARSGYPEASPALPDGR